MKRIDIVGLVLSLSLLGCTSSPPLAGFGDPCSTDGACASGICSPRDSFCTTECASGEPCAESTVCGPDGLCQEACFDGSTDGSGAARTICVAGLFVACSTLDAVANCARCGCEPYGGGTCVASRGCVVPQPDGSACTADVDCTSGTCLRDTDTCGPPRAMGEPCSVDAECETGNCSTDGDETMVGHCNQELDTECSGIGPTATCNDCLRWDSILPPVCTREFCDPVDAPCPQHGLAERIWSCEMSTDGRYRCYEHCTDSGYNCFVDSAYCRSGYCG